MNLKATALLSIFTCSALLAGCSSADNQASQETSAATEATYAVTTETPATTQASAPEVTTDFVNICGSQSGIAVFAGTEMTSCEFSRAVADAAATHSVQDSTFEVNATSPVTGQSYAMTCGENGGVTNCRGGNDALVVLIDPEVAGDKMPDLTAQFSSVYEGTVVLQNTAEVLEGERVPNGEAPTNEYIMLVLDSTQTITARASGSGGSIETREDHRLGLGNLETGRYGSTDTTGPWRQYVGKRIRLHINPEVIWFQSDASLPFAPRYDNEGPFYVEVL